MVSTKKPQGTSKAASKASPGPAAQATASDVVPARTTPVLSESEKQEILNLSPRREQVLALIDRYPGLNSTQLGELINVSMTATSGVLCELFDKQYVHRRRTVAQPGKKVAPYVYFYGRESGQTHAVTPVADQAQPQPISADAFSETKAAAQTAEQASALRAGPSQVRRHAPPPPPVAADPSLFEAEERALLEAMKAPATIEPASVPAAPVKPVPIEDETKPAVTAQGEATQDQEKGIQEDDKDVVQVHFEAPASKPAAPVPGRLGTMPVQARTKPAPASSAIVASLSGAIDELSDRLADVVDGMAEHFSERLSSALSDLVVQAISAKLNAKLHSKTVARLEDVIDNMLPNEVASIEDEAANRMKLANVVIVGLLPDQENMIKDEFKDCFRLRFWKDGNPKSLREISGNADHILTFVDKIGHKHEDAILASGRKPDRVTGGMSSLRKRLTEIYVNQ